MITAFTKLILSDKNHTPEFRKIRWTCLMRKEPNKSILSWKIRNWARQSSWHSNSLRTEKNVDKLTLTSLKPWKRTSHPWIYQCTSPPWAINRFIMLRLTQLNIQFKILRNFCLQIQQKTICKKLAVYLTESMIS